ncbi:MAG: glycosyl transferase [Bacteroidia bacterium]|nr:MAG: glycosyl transferase [Bacteroidia bacterium]
MALTIAVNTRLLLKNKLEGIGWFTYESLKRIVKNHPEHHFVFLFDRPYSEEFIFSSNVTPLKIGLPARHPFLFYLWFEWAIPAALKKVNANLFLSPDGYLSLSTNVPQLPVMHDLNFEHYPKDLPFLMSNYYRYYFPKFAQKAARIATVSQASKDDISTLYQIDKNKIDVVYNGASEWFKPISEEEKKSTRNQYTEGKPYFLYVGSLHPRKNLSNLLKAYDLFRKQINSNTQLLIVGEKYYWTGDMEQTYNSMQYKSEIHFTGRLFEEKLGKVMASARALVYVSYFEGFGIPMVEAMNAEVPVLASNVSCMPEIAGEAAHYVNPFDIQNIADGLKEMDKNELLRNQLIEKGKIQRQNFSWDKTAEKLWSSIEKTI